MNKKLLSIIFCLKFFTSNGQNTQQDVFNIDKNVIRSNLILVNEAHKIPTNSLAYYSIIKEIIRSFSSTDTLNVLIERPYSVAFLYNQILNNHESFIPQWADFKENLLPQKSFIDSLKTLKKNIRFIGVDFEYDNGNRKESYAYFFKYLQRDFEKQAISMEALDVLIKNTESNKLARKDIKNLQVSLNRLEYRSKIIEEAKFILEAKHSFFSNRDKNNYHRFMKFFNQNVAIENSYNLLIYGSSHINPYRKQSIFNYFDKDKKSIFFDNTILIANYYFDCLSYGSYLNESQSKVNSGIYITNNDSDVREELRKNTTNKSITFVKNVFKFQYADFEKIKYFIVHKDVK